MAESKMMAVSIGFALAGIAALAALAGYTFETANGPKLGVDPASAVAPLAPHEAEAAPVAPTSTPGAAAAPVAPGVQVEHESAGREAPSPERSTTKPAEVGQSAQIPPRPTPAPTPNPRPTLTPAPPPAAPGIDYSGVFEPTAIAGDIRTVDFHNGFTYPLAGVGPVEIDGGQAAVGPAGETLDFVVDDVVYGDVTGNGDDDAIVQVQYTDQWGDTLSLLRIFAVRNGMLTDLGSTWADYTAQHQIASVKISGPGTLVVESLSPQQPYLAEATWAVEGQGTTLRRIERRSGRPVVDLRNGSDEVAQIEAGWHGAVRAVVSSEGEGSGVFAFNAQAGWLIDLTNRAGAVPHVRVWGSSGRLIGDVKPGEPLQLAGEGGYVAAVLNGASTTFELEVADQRTLLAPTWEARSRVMQTEDPALRQTRLTWPEFTSAAGAADLAAVNATIEAFVEERRSLHQTQVAAECEPAESSMLFLDFHLTLVSYDLVSIDFSEFICMCENGDSWNDHALTIDMNTGKRIDVLQAAGVQTVGFQRAWWQRTLEQSYIDTTLLNTESQSPRVDTISVTPYGLEVVTEFDPDQPSALAGAHTFVSYEDLEGVIDPALAVRAQSGVAVDLPLQEGCGC